MRYSDDLLSIFFNFCYYLFLASLITRKCPIFLIFLIFFLIMPNDLGEVIRTPTLD